MAPQKAAILAAIALSVLAVTADVLLKRASERANPLLTIEFASALLIYAASAAGWVFVLRTLKLATAGTIYSVCVVLFLAALGAIFFKERLDARELLGVMRVLRARLHSERGRRF